MIYLTFYIAISHYFLVLFCSCCSVDVVEVDFETFTPLKCNQFNSNSTIIDILCFYSHIYVKKNNNTSTICVKQLYKFLPGITFGVECIVTCLGPETQSWTLVTWPRFVSLDWRLDLRLEQLDLRLTCDLQSDPWSPLVHFKGTTC